MQWAIGNDLDNIVYNEDWFFTHFTSVAIGIILIHEYFMILGKHVHTDVETFFDPDTFTLTHLITDTESHACGIIDPVLDFDPKSGRTDTRNADRIISHIQDKKLNLEWILETHVHADHLSGANYIKGKIGSRIGIGGNVTAVQKTFRDIFNLSDLSADGHQFDHLFDDGEQISIGGITGRAIFTPGHTPACVTYVFGDAAFVGDTFFAPDFGTARCDFPGGDAAVLHQSLMTILSLPDDTRIFLCHDYLPGGRALVTHTTVAEQRQQNVHLCSAPTAKAFSKMRQERDATLDMPALLLPSVQVNIRAGALPEAEDNGTRYLKLPLNLL